MYYSEGQAESVTNLKLIKLEVITKWYDSNLERVAFLYILLAENITKIWFCVKTRLGFKSQLLIIFI